MLALRSSLSERVCAEAGVAKSRTDVAMTQPNYRYFVRGSWDGPAAEKPFITGAKLLKTLDSLSGIDPIFASWQLIRNWEIAEDERPRQVPLDVVRKNITAIVEEGIAHDDFGKPTPGYGYSVAGLAGARGPRKVAFSAWTGNQTFQLSFGEHNIASDLSIVTYRCSRLLCWRFAMHGMRGGRTRRLTGMTPSAFQSTLHRVSRRSE